ncbi:DUF6480 family protein [Streptomyces sp. NPDC001292]|uniref:DUF6480 family protein n=1 Tax=Streptomyces sp. NPDC001292 TaxID=3364558 RepID=UPI0036934694
MNAKHAYRAGGPNADRRDPPSPGATPEGPRRPGPENGGAPEDQGRPVEGLAVPEDTAMAPGATPPAESGVSGLGAPEREALSKGWAVAPLTVIWIVVALVAIGLLAMAVVLATS